MSKDTYKQVTDSIFDLYESFKESGFSENQAFELASTYVRQSLFDNAIKNSRNKSLYDDLKKECLNKIKKD